MLATLALAALGLVPAQPGGLTLTNKRLTYGIMGQERKDKQFIIGDLLVLAFDIEGLKAKDDGQVFYSLGMKLVDADGKLQFEQEPRDIEATNSLGGTRTVGLAFVEIRTDTKPGKYTLTVSITDRETKAKQELTQDFEVIAPRLGLVQVNLGGPPVAVVGQTCVVNFVATGFKLDAKKQPNIKAELRVLDADGKPTLKKTPTGEAKEVAEEYKQLLPFQFPLTLNRPGRFRVEIKIMDLNDNGKTVEQTLDFTVYDPK
jgi:hypothetical protein